MADNLEKREPEDGKSISLQEPCERRYWSNALGVPLADLNAAVNAVRSSVNAVRKHLGRNGQR